MPVPELTRAGHATALVGSTACHGPHDTPPSELWTWKFGQQLEAEQRLAWSCLVVGERRAVAVAPGRRLSSN